MTTTLRLTGMTALSSHAAHDWKITINVIRCHHVKLDCHTAGHFAACIGRPERQSKQHVPRCLKVLMFEHQPARRPQLGKLGKERRRPVSSQALPALSGCHRRHQLTAETEREAFCSFWRTLVYNITVDSITKSSFIIPLLYRRKIRHCTCAY